MKCNDDYTKVISDDGAEVCELNKYAITWNNDDGTKNDETIVKHGDTPDHDAIETANPVV